MSETLLQGYIECALWSSTDDNDSPLDDFDGELDQSTRDRMEQDCKRFVIEHAALIAEAREYESDARIGHDFWLTRNGHGAGFWDGDYPEELGDKLTQAAASYGTCDLYVGDDGKIYAS